MIKEELILQYLNNQIAPEQELEVMKWAEENPVDFQLTKEIWEQSSKAKDIKLFDVENEWNTFMMNLEETSISEETPIANYSSDTGIRETTETVILADKVTDEEKPIAISRWKEWRPAMVAATLLFLVTAAYFLWPRTHEVTEMASIENLDITLPDSTQVVVQKGSSIKYLSSFKGQDQRIVYLEGIATFDITPNPDQPFIVQTGNSGIKALGTIFEVDASVPILTGVENIEGLIRFYDKEVESKFKDVKEGESFVYDGSDFVETTPREPIIRRFPAPPPPVEPMYTVKEIINYMYRISNGSATTVGDNFDYNKRIKVNLNTTDINKLIDILDRTPNVVIDAVPKNCRNCFEIRSLLVR